MCYDSSLDEEHTESESEDDLEILLLHSLTSSRQALGPRLHLQDVSETDCEKWFRYWFVKACCIQLKSGPVLTVGIKCSYRFLGSRRLVWNVCARH
jgi:uncharacterized protein YfaT (DUF1175 family)